MSGAYPAQVAARLLEKGEFEERLAPHRGEHGISRGERAGQQLGQPFEDVVPDRQLPTPTGSDSLSGAMA